MTNEEYRTLIDNALEQYFPTLNKKTETIADAMRYSLMAPGKRIRPMLVLEFCNICGGERSAALPFACAVEMVHTYSLIHDDLPCMDDDDYRRGRPSNHVKYGEAVALLAGDALLTLAFDIMLSKENIEKVGADKAACAAGVLARAIGCSGMIGGQVIDILSQGKFLSQKELDFMHGQKTGALIRAACEIGCIIAGSGTLMRDIAKCYAEKLGLAFQIADDVLDVTSSIEEMGKMSGSDVEKSKTTYATIMGIEKSKKEVKELINQAKKTLIGVDGNTDFLKCIADSIYNKIDV